MSSDDQLVSAGSLAREFGLTPGRIRQLAESGVLPSTRTPGGHRRFDIVAAREAMSGRGKRLWDRRDDLAGLSESDVWGRIVPLLPGQTVEARQIQAYAFTEMLNNAIDHSNGTSVRTSMWADSDAVHFEVEDDGVGVFHLVRKTFDLPDEFAAVAELTKGKRTSAAQRHSGEGIFFTTKAVSTFDLSSDGIRWHVDNLRRDQAVGDSTLRRGTRVRFSVPTTSKTKLADVFKEFSQDGRFVRSQPVVRLFELGTEFVSRSEAKRLLAGMDEFDAIALDFDKVDLVGQGFVDEIFRVWAGEHANVAVKPINMSDSVRFMVERGLPQP